MHDSLFSQARRVPHQWWLLLAMAPLLSALVFYSLRYRFPDPPARDVVLAINPAYPELTSATVTVENWSLTPAGAVPADEGPAELRVTIPPGPWRQLRATVIGRADDGWRLRVARDFQSFSLLDVRAGDEVVVEGDELPGPPFSESPVDVRISGGGPGWKSPLRLVHLKLSPLTSSDRPPAVPGALVAGILPLAFALFLARGGRRTPHQSLVIGSLGGAMAIGIALLEPRAVQMFLPAVTGFLLGAASMAAFNWFRAWRSGKSPADNPAILEAALAVAILCLALSFRWEAFIEHRNEPLGPDAAGYMHIAHEGSFYETTQPHGPWIREPLFPAVLRTWLAVAPDTTSSARFLMVLIGMLPVALTWFVGRRLFSPAAALIATAFAACTPWVVDQSVEVLRDTLLTSLLLALMAVPVYAGEWRWGRAVLFGIIGAALALTRVNALFLLVPFVGIEAWRRRWHPAEIAIVFLIAVPLMAPHLAFNARIGDGDLLHSSNVHTRYYLNRAMIGEPGYPATFPEYNRDPYAGDIVGMGKLVSELGVVNVLWRTVRGTIMIFAWEFPHEKLFFGHELPMLFGLLGAWILWKRRRQLWWPVLWFLLFMLPVAVVATIHLDQRLAVPALPIILWTWSAGVEDAVRLLLKNLRPRS